MSLFKGRISFAIMMKWLGVLLLAIILYEYFALPSAAIRNLREENPEGTALMRQRVIESDGNLRIRWSWVPLNRISRNLINAVLAAEDGRFFSHPGIE